MFDTELTSLDNGFGSLAVTVGIIGRVDLRKFFK